MSNYCPYCGTPSKLLFNLVGCLTPACRNYDATWKKEWSSNNKPRYRNNEGFGHSHEFLGNYKLDTTIFDLYTCKSNSNDDICLARFGDSDSECYYVDDGESEIGRVDKGKVASADQIVLKALKEALNRLRKK
jgi:hypothetical protein